ncbi:MAG: isoquinoline 1-oxidoreductase beta subunit [Halioglobus sp.]|jgi:isoquinoline 1-oxidoreductase beta subunit
MGKWTRRGFITAGVVGGGALLIGVALRPGQRAPNLAGFVTEGDEVLINTWVKIGMDNKVTAIVAHSEMGQGAQTALAQMLADELDADWDDVSFLEAPAEDGYANGPVAKGFIMGSSPIPKVLMGTVDGAFQFISESMHLQITGGSASIRASGVYGMRVAGAAAREMLLQSAADEWQVSVDDLTASKGSISHAASGRKESFAHFASAAGKLTPSSNPRLKTPDQFTIMGHSKPRHDIPSKVDGTAVFGIDAQVDGMKYATVAGAPVFGASVKSFDDTEARKMPGVIDVVNLENAVAVVADGYWQAKQALSRIDIQWTDTDNDLTSSEGIFEQFQADMNAAVEAGESTTDLEIGDVATSFEGSDAVIKRSYRVPYLAHTCMEPMNALANVSQGKCEIWTGSQNPLGDRYAVAEALEMDVENVTFNNHTMGGGFGRRAIPDATIQAAKISKASGHPVKLIWSREEDVQHDHYRPAVLSNFSAVLGEDGKPVAWENQFVDKHEPVEAPHILYDVANQHVHYADSPTHVPFGAWRSVDHSQHGFFTESFIDELAYEAGSDPYQYRRELLKNQPRALKVLDLAASKAQWSQALGENRGRGISLQQSFGSFVAEVVEVTVENGKVNVDRVVVAVDAGFAVSPDGLTAQMESGVVYGLTAALYGEISIEGGKVKQGNFDTYQALRMDKMPAIETHIINSLEPWGGAGEPGTPGTAPALANAIFAATGKRVRELPLSKYEVLGGAA